MSSITFAQARDREGLSDLHLRCLPESILSALGRKAVERYYDFVISSPDETVVVSRVADGLVAACVVSHAPKSLLRRFGSKNPGALARDLLRGLGTSRDLRRRCLLRLCERVGSGGTELPEVVQIFTDAAYRGRGLGRELMRFTEAVLRKQGLSEYSIHTLRDNNDAGLRFYQREGFVPVGETRSFGDTYVFMTKGGF